MRVLKNSVPLFKIVYLLAVFFFFMTSSQMVQVPIQLQSLMRKKTQEEMPFPGHFDIAIGRFKAMINEHISNLTVTDEEIANIERLTRGQNKDKLWYDKRKSLLTASIFGKAVKNKVEPSKKLRAMLYSNFTTEAVQYGIESEDKAVALYIREI